MMCNGNLRQDTTYYCKMVTVNAIEIMSGMLSIAVAVCTIVFHYIYIIANVSIMKLMSRL